MRRGPPKYAVVDFGYDDFERIFSCHVVVLHYTPRPAAERTRAFRGATNVTVYEKLSFLHVSYVRIEL